ncbi:hypothetical protein Trydic_g3413 [Trypoxylus dichotomus]
MMSLYPQRAFEKVLYEGLLLKMEDLTRILEPSRSYLMNKKFMKAGRAFQSCMGSGVSEARVPPGVFVPSGQNRGILGHLFCSERPLSLSSIEALPSPSTYPRGNNRTTEKIS